MRELRGSKEESDDIELYERFRLVIDVAESGNEIESRAFEATERISRAGKREVISTI